MPKKIVICCDGTGNQINSKLSNVLKLFRVLQKNDEQLVYYSPGVGTVGNFDEWQQFKQHVKEVLGLATGYGLDENVLDAYRFLCTHYERGDVIYLFGFSRGAYTVRVLAAFVYVIGLLKPSQLNLAEYAFTAYKKASHDSRKGGKLPEADAAHSGNRDERGRSRTRSPGRMGVCPRCQHAAGHDQVHRRVGHGGVGSRPQAGQTAARLSNAPLHAHKSGRRDVSPGDID